MAPASRFNFQFFLGEGVVSALWARVAVMLNDSKVKKARVKKNIRLIILFYCFKG